jgi:hypothetical protein
MISNLVEVYCLADNLTRAIIKKLKKKQVGRKGILNRAMYLTLAVIKQERGIKTTKSLYEIVKLYMKNDFGPLPSYQQFCKGLASNFEYLLLINDCLAELWKSKKESVYIIDSTPYTIIV